MELEGVSIECYEKNCPECTLNHCLCDCHELKTEERD